MNKKYLRFDIVGHKFKSILKNKYQGILINLKELSKKNKKKI